MEIDAQSVLVVTGKGELRRLFCPFPALCIMAVGDISVGDIVMVDRVFEKEGRLVFRIGETLYYHYLFVIRTV
jgi:hypothetical protein